MHRAGVGVLMTLSKLSDLSKPQLPQAEKNTTNASCRERRKVSVITKVPGTVSPAGTVLTLKTLTPTFLSFPFPSALQATLPHRCSGTEGLGMGQGLGQCLSWPLPHA